MVYSEEHVKVTWLGDLQGSPETWSFGVRFRLNTLPVVTSAQDLFDIAVVMLSSNAISMQAGHRLTGVKIALQDVEGRYPEGVDAVEYIAETPFEHTAQGGHPPQCSVVCTTLTSVSRGIASRGRFYLPTTSRDVQENGTLTLSEQIDMAAALATFLDQATDEMGAPAAVFSKVGTGTTRNIVAVGVGAVVDTQRRRRRQLVEAYQTALLNP